MSYYATRPDGDGTPMSVEMPSDPDEAYERVRDEEDNLRSQGVDMTITPLQLMLLAELSDQIGDAA